VGDINLTRHDRIARHMKCIRIGIVFIVPLLFLVISLSTLYDYGWNWDAYQHLVRGQAYLRLFTGGKANNDAVTPYQGRLSYYENNPFDITWLTKVIGHPPATDIINASVNQLLYKHLGIMGDLESYYVWGIFVTALAALSVGLWGYQTSGLVAGVLSVIAYYSLPLLFSEQHFNFKDPSIAAYNTIFLYLFWLGVSRKNSLYLLLASLVGGLSLGTKFNILFFGPVLLVWLIWYMGGRIGQWFRSTSIRFTVMFFLVPIVMVAVFYCTYPLLWSNFSSNMISVIDFYRQVGGGRCPYAATTGMWFIRCTDWQTVRLFMVTIPIPTLILGVIGGILAFKLLGRRVTAPFLWVLVFVSIVIRVVTPISSLYGGSLRQILEFIGPLSLLAGLGGSWLVSRYKPHALVFLCLILLYVPVFWSIKSLYPNENLYYNAFVGGVGNAVQHGYPLAVNTYGNGYKQAIDWINKNVPYGSSVYLVEGLSSAVPSIVFRHDILYKGQAPQLHTFDGSYLMELTEPGMDIDQIHNTKFVHAFLIPVYEKKVDSVPIVSVWKNDAQHSVKTLDFTTEVKVIPAHTLLGKDEVVLDLGGVYRLKRLEMKTTNPACAGAINSTYVLRSTDGVFYTKFLNVTSDFSLVASKYQSEGIYIFTGERARFIKFYSYNETSCDLTTVAYSVIVFP
jgi:hypothetical protein